MLPHSPGQLPVSLPSTCCFASVPFPAAGSRTFRTRTVGGLRDPGTSSAARPLEIERRAQGSVRDRALYRYRDFLMKTRYFRLFWTAAAGFWRFGIRQISCAGSTDRRVFYYYGTKYVREQQTEPALRAGRSPQPWSRKKMEQWTWNPQWRA